MKYLNNETMYRYLYRTLLAVYVACILPLLWIGLYNWPSADDFSMARAVRMAFLETGSLSSTLVEGVRSAYRIYMTWTGYYFSDFVTAVAPSVFGEQYYFLVPIILLAVFTFSMLYFFHALLTKYYGVRWHLAGAIAFLTMLLIVQCMPAGETTRVEAFYWWSGACNYLFMWSLGVLWCGLLISCACDTGRKKAWEYLCACVLGFLLGGANYMTGLTLAIVSVLLIAGKCVRGTGTVTHFPILPCLLNLVGFAVACLAPGNYVRGAFGQGFPAVKSILISLYYTLSYCIDEWTTWVVICILLLLAILLWMAADGSIGTGTMTHFSEKWVIVPVPLTHPVIACLLAYGLISANMTPILFTRGDIGAGRMQSIEWAQYILLLVLLIGYLTGYAVQALKRKHVLRLDADKQVRERREKMMRRAACVLVLFIVFGSALSVGVDPHYYTTTSAVTDLVNGNAARYRAESEERLRILQDDTVTDALIPAYSARPKLLYFSDATPDANDWLNTSMAEYYHKGSVRVE